VYTHYFIITPSSILSIIHLGLDVLEKGDEVVCAIEVAWIFVNAPNFGPTLRLKQAMIFKSKTQDFDSVSDRPTGTWV
jgi:hypothetical protein